ncbi:MAG: hypothetical protein ACLGHZ_00165 [Actinomycetes bacterium]
MDLPLLLAGPILRRVDPGLVAVWVALSEPATVTLSVWEGRVAADTPNPAFATSDDPPDPNAPPPRPGAATLRIGDKLHLGLVSVRLPPASGKAFQPDRLYSYDVRITRGGTTVGLSELGLLTEHFESGVRAEPLGYDDRMLPSFALPPSSLDDLQIAYGSCRRPSYDDGDALAWLDQHVAERVADPRARVHQLFLGGDQIYADDVDSVMMLRITELGVALIGTSPDPASPGTPVPIERVKVDQVLTQARPPQAADPNAAYTPETAAQAAQRGDLPAGSPSFPVGGAYGPAGGRLDLTTRSAQFTSIDGSNHLISLGEFAACYLMVWSPACWGDEIPGAILRPAVGATTGGSPLHWLDQPTDSQDIAFPQPPFPGRIPKHLFADAATIASRAQEAAKVTPAERARSRRASHRVHREFLLGLARARRVLANVPTYMVLDDHDLTDDFFLSPLWRRRVLGTALGHVILTNGMTAYALFQDWGNDPRKYDIATSPARPDVSGPGDLLDRAAQLFRPGRPAGPDADAFAALNRMFGHDLDNKALPDGRFGAVRPPLTWHFTIDGPKHRVVALDNRTRRSYVAEIGPPGNVAAEALVDQLPPPPLPAGREVLVVIAPLQVIGPPVIDEVVARAIYRIFDLAKAGELAEDETSGSRRMPGTNPDALETWAFDPITYEHLLARLAEYGRVVLLSGDVHNAASNAMSYWRGAQVRPSRIAQFTSSGLKNVMPVYLRALDRSAMLLQELLRAKLGTERFGWTRSDADLVLLPTGRSVEDLVADTRARLARSPVLLPAHGWLDDNDDDPATPPLTHLTSRLNPARPPDWRWRITPLLDERLDADRPSPIRVPPLDDALIEAQLADPAQALDAYQAVAARHQASLDRMRNTRQMMFRSNFGICRFEAATDGALTAIGEVHTSSIDPETQLPILGPYMVHRAPLGPLDEPPPDLLRESVLERVGVPEAQP